MQGLAGLIRATAVAACVCFATTAAAASSKSKKAGKQVVALVPTTADGNVAKAQLESIDRALANSAGQHAEVVAVRVLDKRVTRGSFPAAVKACKRDGACLAKLARNSKVEVIVAPTAKADSDGITVTTTVAGVNDTIHRVSFTFATAADLNAAIAKNANELFSSAQASEEPALESLAALPLEPLENQATTTATPPPVVPPPTTDPLTVAKVDTTPPPDEPFRKGKGKNPQQTTVVAEPEPTPPPLVDVISSPMGTTQVMPRPRSAPHAYGWGTYVGVGVAAAGVAGVTYGIIEYMQHKNIVDNANSNTTLTQREAAVQDQAAKSKYDNSRIGLYAGVPLLIAGAGLVAWDIAIADHKRSAATDGDNHLKLTFVPTPSGGFFSSAALSW